jgi:polyisoprenoid-binding protein YceI
MTTPSASVRDFEGNAIPTPGTFSLDPAHTTVGFVVRHLMVSKVRGRFGAVTGTVTVADDPYASSVAIEIDVASIDTGVADRDTHLRSAEFLDIEHYPKLTFTSSRILDVKDNTFRLAGDLAIRDVAREVVLDVEFEGVAVSPWGQEVVAFSATTEIDREEFGITWNQALEAGGFVVGKTVKIEISAEVIRLA